MADRACVQRLQKEFRALSKEPVPNVVARPSPSDILEWHYVLEGSEGTPFAGGVYHGKLKFPSEYPFKPPSIIMITPSGRFATQKRICMSMSDFHPESWNPMWSVSSILTGLLSFMMDNAPTTGSVFSTIEEKQRLAHASLAFNCKSATFRKMFPEYVEKYESQKSANVKTAKVQEEEDVSKAAKVLDNAIPTAQINTIPEGKVKTVVAHKQKVPTRRFPVWVTAILLAAFASMMALPLLSLDSVS